MQRRHARPAAAPERAERAHQAGKSPGRVNASPHIRAIFGGRPASAPRQAVGVRGAPSSATHQGVAATGTSWGARRTSTPTSIRGTGAGGMTPRTPRGGGLRLTDSAVRLHGGAYNGHSTTTTSPYQPWGQARGTPGGAHSEMSVGSTAVNFTSMIADAVTEQMQSMADMRARIEELTALQAREEAAQREKWARIHHQSEQVVRSAQEETEAYYEGQLQVERSGRLKAVELLQRFRSEGDAAMRKMRDALQDAQNKWREEAERNKALTTALAQAQQTPLPPSLDGTSSAQVSRLMEKVGILANLLEEEEAVVVELECRNKVLEHGMAAVLQERDRLTAALNEATSESETLDREYGAVLEQLNRARESRQALGRGEDAKVLVESLEGQLKSLNQFTALLVKRLKNEQRQRLVSEEQSARVASAQETMIKKLEGRIKELQARRPASPIESPRGNVDGQRTPTSANTPRTSVSTPRAGSNTSGRVVTPQKDPSLDSQISMTVEEEQVQGGAGAGTTGEGSASPNVRAEAALRDYLTSPGVVGGMSPNRRSPRRLEAYRTARARINVPGSTYRDGEADAAAGRSASPLSLEEQLAAVTADFNHSIDELARTTLAGPITHSRSPPVVPALRFSPSIGRVEDASGGEDDFDFDPDDY